MDIYERLGLPRPSFWEGVARTLDIGGVFSAPRSMPPARQDGEILASDWEAVGADMWAALGQFAEQEGLPFEYETEEAAGDEAELG